MTSRADPRHRAVEVIEAGLTEAGCDTSAHLSRWLVARLEAVGLIIRDTPRLAEDPVADPRTDPTTPGHPNADYAAARAALHERTRQ